ncbi:hypothetical protein AUR66_17645 [Haloferax profundi]|uniref:Uncharacterized protein n=1 Tax=Haloferax profundi TaxID=1544718 RepID=A0A0W1S301_9EURY|nr:hypothetical protein AUR66_17645 [Haloferax profundi]
MTRSRSASRARASAQFLDGKCPETCFVVAFGRANELAFAHGGPSKSTSRSLGATPTRKIASVTPFVSCGDE